MRNWGRWVKNFISKPSAAGKADYIFYRIVESNEVHHYLLQCINTRNVFYSTLNEIILDRNILYGLHPIQACYIGIEHARNFKSSIELLFEKLLSRYGLYRLLYQDRSNNIGFLNKKTQEEFLIPLEKVAFSEGFIEEFDAIEAFYIGFLVGKNLDSSLATEKINPFPPRKYGGLTVIKGGR